MRYYGFCHPTAKASRMRVQLHSGRAVELGNTQSNPTRGPDGAGLPSLSQVRPAHSIGLHSGAVAFRAGTTSYAHTAPKLLLSRRMNSARTKHLPPRSRTSFASRHKNCRLELDILCAAAPLGPGQALTNKLTLHRPAAGPPRESIALKAFRESQLPPGTQAP